MLKKSTSMVCQQCKIGWPIRDSDTFCGYCGAKVADYDLKIVGGPAYTDEIHNVSLRLSLSNKGSVPVKTNKIQPKAPWLMLEETGPWEITVDNSPREIGITIDLSNPLTQAPRELRGSIEVQPESRFQKKDIVVEISPPPVFGFTEEAVKFERSKSEQEVYIELNMLVQKSTVIFDDIQPEDSCKNWLHISQPSVLGKELKAGDNLVLTVLIDLQKMPIEDETEVILSFNLRGRQNNEPKSFKLVPLLAPDLQIDEAMGDGRIQITATKDKKQDFQLHLRNAGGGEIDLSKLDYKPRPNWLKLSTSQQVLKKGEDATLMMSVDGNSAPEGKNSFELIHPEQDKIFEFPFFLETTIRALPVYPHYLAVDFGTTNSCCVHINENHEPESIILDKYAGRGRFAKDDVIPSTIFYTGEDNGEFRYLIGSEANNRRLFGRYAGNYFRSIKRLIGSDEDFYITVENKRIPLKPYQIASDIIRHLLERTEEQLEQKITRCVVAHPTMFSQREVDELRRIYTDELGIKDILMLDEATAASLDYIFQRNKKNKGKLETYYIVVYDFGGGTTDIALLLVNAKKGSLKIEPLDVGGSRMLGGDDITEHLVKYILKEYQERLEAKWPMVSIDIPFCTMTERYESSGDKDFDEKTRENSYLYEDAERIKIEVSNNMTEVEEAFRLWVSIGGELKDIEEESPEVRHITISYSLIEEWLSPRLDDMLVQIETMFKDTEEHPKVILLAGQSSAIPLIKQKMKQRFHEVQIVSAEDLKTCVAAGSSRYARIVAHQTADGDAEPIEVVEFTSKTHSAYGIVTINEFFEEEFQAVIPKRARIPDESFGVFKMRLRKQAIVPVYENTGVKNLLEGNEEIHLVGSYIYDFSQDGVPEEELRKVELEMSMGRDEQIDVVANINGKSYKFIRQENRL